MNHDTVVSKRLFPFSVLVIVALVSFILKLEGDNRHLRAQLVQVSIEKDETGSKCRAINDPISKRYAKPEKDLRNPEGILKPVLDDERFDPAREQLDSGTQRPSGSGMRIVPPSSIVAKFVTLTSEESRQLQERAEREREIFESHVSSEERARALAELPSVESIIGEEKFESYKTESKRLFSSMEQNRQELESLEISHKLGLTEERTEQIKSIIKEVDQENKRGREDGEDLAPPVSGADPREFFKKMKERRQRRDDLLQQKLQRVLSEDEFNRYLEIQANRPNIEMLLPE